VRVADIEWVRTEFYKIYHADSETEEGSKAAKRKQFNRTLSGAQEKGLVCVRTAPAAELARSKERTLIWLAKGHAR
jgi:hypothetical protein